MQKFDHPHMLLKNKDGILYEMVQQTGPAMAESLCKMAQIVSTSVLNSIEENIIALSLKARFIKLVKIENNSKFTCIIFVLGF
jgi:ATP-binding cassette subfamily C (CFTR/MRP) protein 4